MPLGLATSPCAEFLPAAELAADARSPSSLLNSPSSTSSPRAELLPAADLDTALGAPPPRRRPRRRARSSSSPPTSSIHAELLRTVDLAADNLVAALGAPPRH
ncbi:hypothetical protein ACP70R_050203 [Stipagrostis hirtigluma subsp. patula]